MGRIGEGRVTEVRSLTAPANDSSLDSECWLGSVPLNAQVLSPRKFVRLRVHLTNTLLQMDDTLARS